MNENKDTKDRPDDGAKSDGNGKDRLTGVFSNELRDRMYALISKAYSQAAEITDPECAVPEAGANAEKTQTASCPDERNASSPGGLAACLLPAAVAAVSTCVGGGLGAPLYVLVVLSAGGAAIGAAVHRIISNRRDGVTRQKTDDQNESVGTPETVPEKPVSKANSRDKQLAQAKKEIDRLCESVAAYEKRNDERFDIGLDREFGDWVQRFLVYTEARPDDLKLQLLRDQLIVRLSRMKIRVYDEVVLNAEGKPDVPYPDYLIDSRTGENYEKVTRPVVYSDRSLLARGEIV